MKKNRDYGEILSKYALILCVIWFFASWFQIVGTSDGGSKVSKWNMLHVFGYIEANASEYTAEHEEHKAISSAKYMRDLDLLSRLIYSEGGCASYVSDDMCYGIGSVALNRVKSDVFPDTLEEVIYQSGQYACIYTHYWYEEPNERSLQIAEWLLHEGSEFPDDVLYQAEFVQGSGVYLKIQNMYFCRK